MTILQWLKRNTSSLKGKTVALTGSTGGLGRPLCRYLCSLGASLILLDRDPVRSSSFRNELIKEYRSSIKCITIDLEDFETVKRACNDLKKEEIDVFIHNAGAYKIPRRVTSIGYDNSFQINFISPFYITNELLPVLRKRKGRIIVVGSVAHNYSVLDETDIDFHTRRHSSKVYGNAKRFLMFSHYELFKDEKETSLAVVHPGISFTNITNHFPKLLFALIKYPMKIIFMHPRKASLSILKGVFESVGEMEWIGPRIFNVWGFPRKALLSTALPGESQRIKIIADSIIHRIRDYPCE